MPNSPPSRDLVLAQLIAAYSVFRDAQPLAIGIHKAIMAAHPEIDQSEGRYRFRDFFRNEKKMALVFQYFVFNFLRAERKDLRVFREDTR